MREILRKMQLIIFRIFAALLIWNYNFRVIDYYYCNTFAWWYIWEYSKLCEIWTELKKICWISKWMFGEVHWFIKSSLQFLILALDKRFQRIGVRPFDEATSNDPPSSFLVDPLLILSLCTRYFKFNRNSLLRGVNYYRCEVVTLLQQNSRKQCDAFHLITNTEKVIALLQYINHQLCCSLTESAEIG